MDAYSDSVSETTRKECKEVRLVATAEAYDSVAMLLAPLIRSLCEWLDLGFERKAEDESHLYAIARYMAACVADSADSMARTVSLMSDSCSSK